MKIIDLLNKIANFDYKTLPKKFKYNGYCYSWCRACEIYEAIDEEGKRFNLYDYIARDGTLNDEIEILEEVKNKEYEDIEELDVALLGQCDNWLRCPTNEVTKQDIELNPYIIDNVRENTLEFQHKINALIRNQKYILGVLHELQRDS